MKRSTPCSQPLASRQGFTLVELLVVMSIICVLSAMVLAGANYAQTKAAMSRADSEIHALETACESYKADNGDYPRFQLGQAADNSLSDRFDATEETPPTSAAGDSSKYSQCSLVLYSNLSGDQMLNGIAGYTDPTTGIKNKVYFEFRPNMLYPNPAKYPAGKVKITALVDPWNVPYGYSTINLAQTTNPLAGQTSPKGFNPTFDLWSTCNELPAKPAAATHGVSGDPSLRWITNW